MKTQTFLALIALAMMTTQAAQAGHAKPKPTLAPIIAMPEQDEQHLLHDTFVVVKIMRELPKAVRKQVIPDGKDVRGGMADFGQAYESSDMVGPKPLPFRRLIFAAISQDRCLVYYEFGGFVSGQRVELFRLSGGQAAEVWSGILTGARQLLTLAQLRTEVSKGHYFTLRRGG